jgi:site-specific DNA-methyltransferase (adenine-specific)
MNLTGERLPDSEIVAGEICPQPIVYVEDACTNASNWVQFEVESAASPETTEALAVSRNRLYYGDNLEILRKYVRDETVDLCYIDPPFNSKRQYNFIYTNRGDDDSTSRTFVDTWRWRERADGEYDQIISNRDGRFTSQTIELIQGLRNVLKPGPLLAYLVSMTVRMTEIHRVLKPAGIFYFHCDPTASHYLKIVADAVFCARGGDFLNEIIWCYSIGGKSKDRFGKKHDVILGYCKGHDGHTFNKEGACIPRKPDSHMRTGVDADGRAYQEKTDRKSGKVYRYYMDEGKIAEDYWTDIETLNREDKERLGYPTQKPERLLERIIKTSSNEGDVVLDAYCGCGTSIEVAQHFNRRWIGIDITYHAISTVLTRLEDNIEGFDRKQVEITGIPRDMASARDLAHKHDDRLRKEFEKWAILTYCKERAVINEKKGADRGIDGIAYIRLGETETAKMILQVKSGAVKREHIATLQGDMVHNNAQLGALITLEDPTRNMKDQATAAGRFEHQATGIKCDKIRIVTIEDIVDGGQRLELPLDMEALKEAIKVNEKQLAIEFGDEEPEPDELPLRKAPEAVTEIQRKKRELS